jgi:hypothetical protein
MLLLTWQSWTDYSVKFSKWSCEINTELSNYDWRRDVPWATLKSSRRCRANCDHPELQYTVTYLLVYFLFTGTVSVLEISVITLTPQKEVSCMVEMKTSKVLYSAQAYSCIPFRPLITHNQSKALDSSRDYHEVIVINISVNICLDKWNVIGKCAGRSTTTNMWRHRFLRLFYVASVQDKVVPMRTMELYWAAGGTIPLYLNFDTGWQWIIMPVLISNGKRAPCIHRTGGCVGPKHGMDALDKIKSESVTDRAWV